MRAFVTGASGFVGTHLVHHLWACGDHVTGPLTDITDRDAVAAAVADARPDCLYHLAGRADVGASWDEPLDTLRVNVEGTLNVLDGARAAGVGRVLVVTSAEVYGRVPTAQLPIGEETPLRPVSPYAASKAAAEMLCIQAGLGHGLEVIRVRAFNHLGPGQSDRFVASALASRVAENERVGNPEVRIGNLDVRRDFTDVRDVVRAYRLLIETGRPGEAYNVCSGADVAVRDLAEEMVGLARTPMRLVVDPELVRPVEVPVLRGDRTKLTRETGWEPAITLDRTLTDVLDHWRDSGRREVGHGAAS